MNTLELFLFKAGGENVEATHQRILAWLLESKAVVEGLLNGLEVKNPKTRLEAHGKLFDIQINDDNGERALIEIKMWSSLSINQQRRQQDAAKVPLYYFLFGISGLERIPDKEKTFNMSNVAKKLKILSKKTAIICKELEVDNTVAMSEFIMGYANRLQSLQDWLIKEAWKSTYNTPTTKSSHYASLFHQIKEKIGKRYSEQFNMPIYRTEKGQNVTLEINHFDTSGKDANRSVSIAETDGKLIFWIKNEHLEIFFNGDSKVYPSGTTLVRNAFNTLWSSQTNLSSGKKLRLTGKKGTEWVCLLRIGLFPVAIEHLEILEETVDKFKKYYDAFLEVQNSLKA